MQDLLLFLRQSFPRIWFKPPLYFLISSIICTFIAIKLGGFFVFFFVFYCIFGSIFIYRNLSATWAKAYTKYGLNNFFEFSKMRRINRQKLLLRIMVRRKFILRKYKDKFYRKELFEMPYWNLCKTNFKDYTFNKNNIATIYKLFNKDLVLKHHISYYQINQSIDGRSKTLIEQNLLKNYILSKKTLLSQIERQLKMQNTIVGDGKLLIKKVYAKYFVYDHKTNSKIRLSCYALCWETPDAICVPIVALGRWCIESMQKKPWYVILERNVYHEAFLADCPFAFYDVPQKKSPSFDFTPYKTALAKDFENWKNVYKKWFTAYFMEWFDAPHNNYLILNNIYLDIKWWYKENIEKRGKSWRKRAIRRLFYPVRKRRLKRRAKEFFYAIIADPFVYSFWIFGELLLVFVLQPLKYLEDRFQQFLRNWVASRLRDKYMHDMYVGETIYSPYIEERYDAYMELFEHYWIKYFPEYGWTKRLLPGLQNLKKYPFVFLKETIRLIPIFIKEIYNQSKFVFSWISISLRNLLVFPFGLYSQYKLKSTNQMVETKGKDAKSEKLKYKQKNQKEYLPTDLKYWRKHYVRLLDRVIHSFYWQNYPTYMAKNNCSLDVLQRRFYWRYALQQFNDFEPIDIILLENMATLRHIYYEHNYQPWWEPHFITELEFADDLKIITMFLIKAKVDSEIIVTDLLTTEETLIQASCSKSTKLALTQREKDILLPYMYILYCFKIYNQMLYDVPIISKTHLEKVYLPYDKSLRQLYEEFLQTKDFYPLNQIQFASAGSIVTDMELVRTKHKHNTNGIRTITRALKSNDWLWNAITSKFIIIELKSKSLILEAIIKESCEHIYKIFTKNSNKTKIKVSQKKTLKKKYLKFKLDMLNTYVKNYTKNKLNTSSQYFFNNEKKKIMYIMDLDPYEIDGIMFELFSPEKSQS